MNDRSLGADLVGPERLPRVTLSPLLGALAALPPGWIARDGDEVVIDAARALDGARLSMPVHDVGCHDTAILGGLVDAPDLAAASRAAGELRASIASQLDAMGLGATPHETSSESTRELRFSRGRFTPLREPPRHNALVVWSTREEFPGRRELCDLLDRAVRRHLGEDVGDRFYGDLPYTEDREPSRRTRGWRQIDAFLKFLQEHGMARVRVRVAFRWMDAVARAIPDEEGRRVRRYVSALEAIVAAAAQGTVFSEASLDALGILRPRAWATTTFVSGLPLVPRADCEYAERDDDDLRRGPEGTREIGAPSGRNEVVHLRHVTWLPRFNASGPDVVDHLDGRRLRTTTLTSRALLLERALKEGAFDGRVPSRDGAWRKLLRALEYHVVVRAAQQAADGEGDVRQSAVSLVQKMLEHLDDPARRRAGVERIVAGYRRDAGSRRAVEARIETWSQCFASFAGGAEPSTERLSFALCLDRSIFAARSVSPLIAARNEGDAGSGPPWAWMAALSVREGDGDPGAAMCVRLGVTLEPKVLRWEAKPSLREAFRIDDRPVVVVLDRCDGDERDTLRRRLYEDELGIHRRDVTAVIPRIALGDKVYSPDDGGLPAASRGLVAAASILTRAAVVAAVRRIDPEGHRGVRIVSAFDASIDVRDSRDDVVLRALGRALRGAFVDRAAITQGAALSNLVGDATGARRLDAAERALHRGAAVRFPGIDARATGGALGIVVLAGRPVDCVRERSGEPVDEDGHDVLWGTAYLAGFDRGAVTVRDVGRVHCVLHVADEWPAPILVLLKRFRELGCAEVALVSHRAHERRTWRNEARNRFYDGDLPIERLVRQPECEGLRIISLVCDSVTAVAADPADGLRAAQGRLIVADGQGLYPEGVAHGLRPIVAVATNRTPRQVLATDARGQRRIGLRRRIHLYAQRSLREEPALGADLDARLVDALAGIHHLEGESDYGGTVKSPPLLVPVLRPHKSFEVVRRADASELLFHDGHARTWVNLLGFNVATRSLMREDRR